jgi:peptide/nickel transport system substrate-binding protein
MYGHLQRMPPPVSTVDRSLPSALDAVLIRGLAKQPEDRFGTAGELAEAARAALRGDRPRPKPTRPEPIPLQKFPGPFPRVPPDPVWPAAPPPRPRTATSAPRRAWQIGGAVLAAAALVVAGVVGVRALVPEPAPAPTAGLAACGTSPVTCNDAAAEQLVDGGQVAIAIDTDITSWNVASIDGSVGPARWAMAGLLPYTFGIAPDLTDTLNGDLLSETTQTDPRTVVYVLRPGASWDDGTPVGVEDFRYNWRVRNGRDCPDCGFDPTGYERITGITEGPPVGEGSAVTVTFDEPYPDWRSLFASSSPLYPAHIAARHGDLDTPDGLRTAFTWFDQTVPDYSAGPLRVRSWQPGDALVLERNPSWYGRPARLDRVVLRVVADPAAQVDALRSGAVQVIAPASSAELTGRLSGVPGVEVYLGAGLAWERLDLNLRTRALADPALRRALFTAVDLDRVRSVASGAFGRAEPMGSHNFVPGQDGYADVLGGSGQGRGDVEAARAILSEAGYTGVGSALVAPDGTPVPPLRAVYTTYSPARRPTAEYLAQAAAQLGLALTPTPTDNLVALSSGDYDLILYSWGVSPNHVGHAQQSWSSTGKANYGGYTDPEVDRLLAEAAGTPDTAAAHDLLNRADRLLTDAAYVLPLYRRPTLLAIRQDVANVRDNPAEGPLYNVADWAVRAR